MASAGFGLFSLLIQTQDVVPKCSQDYARKPSLSSPDAIFAGRHFSIKNVRFRFLSIDDGGVGPLHVPLLILPLVLSRAVQVINTSIFWGITVQRVTQ